MQGTFAVNGTDAPELVSGSRRGGLRVAPPLFGRSSSSHVAPLPPPLTVEKIPGGFKVVDANQQSLAIDNALADIENRMLVASTLPGFL